MDRGPHSRDRRGGHRVRRRALEALKKLEPADLTTLRRATSAWEDPEVLGSIRDVILHLVRKEGEALYRDGHTEEALLKLAEADGASDPAATHRERLRKAGEWLSAMEPRAEDGIVKRLPASEFAGDFWKKHGRWAIAAVLDRVRTEYYAGAFYMLKSLPFDEVLPALCGAVSGGSDEEACLACALLACKGRGEPRVIRILESVAADCSRSVNVQSAVVSALQDLQ